MATKVALVGIGRIARDQHVPAIAANPAFELAATASRDAAGVDGVERFADLAALLDARPDIRCVSLCTPPQARYADARRALDAGRHLMLEKPPGATLGEVHDLAGRAAASGLTLFVTWHSRHAAAVPAARAWLAGRRPRRVEIEWREDVRRWHPGQDWLWRAGGLGIFDPGINAISLLTAIHPRALRLVRAELAFPANRDTPIAASLELRDPDDVEIVAELDWRQRGPQTWDVRVATDAGDALLADGGARLVVDGTETVAGPDPGTTTLDHEYAGLYARLAELLATGASDVDLAPLRHVADAFAIGRRATVEPFEW